MFWHACVDYSVLPDGWDKTARDADIFFYAVHDDKRNKHVHFLGKSKSRNDLVNYMRVQNVWNILCLIKYLIGDENSTRIFVDYEMPYCIDELAFYFLEECGL